MISVSIDDQPSLVLLHEHDTLCSIIEDLHAGVVVHDSFGTIVYANERAAELLGWRREMLQGVRSDDARWRFVHRDLTFLLPGELPVTRILDGEKIDQLVLGVPAADERKLVWVMCNGFTTRAITPRGLIAVITFTDVTDLENTARALHDSEERLRLVLRGGNDAAWDRDIATGELFQSARVWEIIGEESPVAGGPDGFWDHLHPDDVDQFREHYRAALESDTSIFSIQYRLRHRKGHYVPIRANAFISRDTSGKALRISGTVSDLTEQRRHEDELYRLGFFDSLTALPNRRQLIDQAGHALSEAARSHCYGALLFIDLDNFKDLNDALGHVIGDAVLREAANRIRAIVRDLDIVARFGGDEFVVILQHLPERLDEAATVAESMASNILRELSAPYELERQWQSSSASVGISLFNGVEEAVDSLLKQADLALHNAKAVGRNTFKFFNRGMQELVDERHAMENGLRLSLSEGEMFLYYQAQIAASGSVVGAEVLLRWKPHGKQMILPAQFIALAESTGFIEVLGMWALRKACEQLVMWEVDPAMAQLTLSVNVSVRQFSDTKFVEKILEVVGQSGANPERLKLEITETLFADSFEDVVGKMVRLAEYGIYFSLDDFGVGYSSLQYLQKMPLRELKIDRVFTAEIDSGKSTVPRIILSLGKEMKLHVVAEGIEQNSQFEYLKEHGCETFQGYLFSKPCPVEDFEALTLRLAR